jgi:CBS domain containing-hemolysin-like protein
VTELLILLGLLVLSGVFSGSETALVALTIARAEALHAEGRGGAKALAYLKRHPTRMLITILIGNNVVNIGASAMATVIATEHLGKSGPGVAVGVLTFVILIFGEITPKSLATRYSERISLFIAPVMYGLMRLLLPLVWMFERLTKYIQSMTGQESDPIVTEMELISLAEHGEVEGTIAADEREMIERVFILDDLKASDVMTPRGDVFLLNSKLRLKDVMDDLISASYTRIPLYSGYPDQIEYILYMRSVLAALAHGRTEVQLKELANDPLFCHESQPIDELLTVLRKSKQHMAIVVDEHGTTQGVVTLEDLLEELVGEIYDESDELPDEYMRLSKSKILVEGGSELRVVESFFGIDLPGKPTDTVSRWILLHTNRIPETDEQFEFDGLDVTIHSATTSHIEQLIVKRAGG